MKNTKFIFLPISFLFLLGCPSKRAVASAEDSKDANRTRAGQNGSVDAVKAVKELEEKAKIAEASGDALEAEQLRKKANEQAEIAKQNAKKIEEELSLKKEELKKKISEKDINDKLIDSLTIEISSEEQRLQKIKEALMAIIAELKANIDVISDNVIDIDKLYKLKENLASFLKKNETIDAAIETIKSNIDKIKECHFTQTGKVKVVKNYNLMELRKIVAPILEKIKNVFKVIGETKKSDQEDLFSGIRNSFGKLNEIVDFKFSRADDSTYSNFKSKVEAARTAVDEKFMLLKQKIADSKIQSIIDDNFASYIQYNAEVRELKAKKESLVTKTVARDILVKEISDISAKIRELEK